MWRPHLCKKRCCLDCADVRQCGECGENKPKQLFDDPEWKRAGWKQRTGRRGATRGRCRKCTKENPMLQLCTGVCGEMLPEYCFSAQMWAKVAANKMRCKDCCKGAEHGEDVCTKCGQSYSRSHFSDWQWLHVGRGKRKCRSCCTGPNSPQKQEEWTCVRHDCKKTLPKSLFHLWMAGKTKQQQRHHYVCNQCFIKEKHEREKRQRETQLHVQKRGERK